MIGTAVVVGGVLFAIMQMGSAPKPLSDEELAGPAPKKKQKKAAPAPAPAEKKKKKKKALKGGSTLSSDLLDSPADKEEEQAKSKSKKKKPAAAKPAPKKEIKTTIDAPPVELKQSEIDDGWGIAMGGGKKKKKSKPAQSKKGAAAPTFGQSITAASKLPEGSSASAEVKIDGRKLGILIGPGGATIKALQEATGAKIELPERDKGEEMATGPCLVTITGDAKAVAAAHKAVQELGSKGYTSVLETGNFTEGAISVPIPAISELIGKRGVIIKTIQDTFEVRLNFPDTKNIPQDGFGRQQKKTVKVGIAGDKANVAKAKQCMKDILKFHHHTLTHPGMTHIELNVSEGLYSFVIGPKGSSIKHIQNNFDVKVHIPGPDDANTKILVVGAPSDCQLAKKYVDKLIEKATAEPEEQEEEDWKKTDESYDSRYDDEGPHEAWMDQYKPPPRKTGWA